MEARLAQSAAEQAATVVRPESCCVASGNSGNAGLPSHPPQIPLLWLPLKVVSCTAAGPAAGGHCPAGRRHEAAGRGGGRSAGGRLASWALRWAAEFSGLACAVQAHCSELAVGLTAPASHSPQPAWLLRCAARRRCSARPRRWRLPTSSGRPSRRVSLGGQGCCGLHVTQEPVACI